MRKILLAAAMVLAVGVGQAKAAVLAPGGSVSPVPNDVSAPGTLLASVVRTVVGDNALGEVLFTGELRAQAYRNASGTIDFYYQYLGSTGPDNVSRVTHTNFTNWVTDVYARNDSATFGGFFAAPTAGADPLSADRSASGSTVGFEFLVVPDPGLAPTDVSYIMVIKTDAKNFTVGTTNLLNGAIDSVQTFAPVPEPASMLLLGAGLLGLAGVARGRR